MQRMSAGNDNVGLKYGTVGTSESLFLIRKKDETDHRGYEAKPGNGASLVGIARTIANTLIQK